MAFDLSNATPVGESAGSTQKKFDLSSAVPVREPMTAGGFAENVARGISDLGESVVRLPETVWNLPGAAYGALEDAFGLRPGSRERVTAAQHELAKKAAQAAVTSFSATQLGPAGDEARQTIARIPYEHPVDVGMFIANPLAKGLASSAEGLKAAQAARMATGATGLTTRGMGALANVAEAGAKVAPYLNPLLPGEKLLKLGVKGIGGSVKYLQAVVDPTTAEIKAILGPYMETVSEYLKPTTEGPLHGVVGRTMAPEIGAGAAVGQGEAAAATAEEAAGLLKKGPLLLQPEALASKGPRVTRGVAEVGPEQTPGAEVPKVEMGVPEDLYGYEDVLAPFRSAGEKAAGAGVGGRIFAAMQDVVRGFTPESRRVFMAQMDKRNVLRQKLVDEGARSPERLTQMAKEAEKTGDIPYDNARNINRVIDLKPVDRTISDIIKNNPSNRPLRSTLESIRQNLRSGSDPRTVASMIDELKSTIGETRDKLTKARLTAVKKSFYQQFKEYADADAAYAKNWAPVHRAQINTYLSGLLKQKNGVKLFNAAVNNPAATIAKATGQTMFKSFGPIFEGAEGELGRLRYVAGDIDSQMKFMAAATDPEARALADAIYRREHISLPGVLNTQVSVTKWIMQHTQGKWTLSQAEKFAKQLLNPETALPALQRAIQKDQVEKRVGKLANKIIDYGTTLPAGAAYLGSQKLGDLTEKYQLYPGEEEKKEDEGLDNLSIKYDGGYQNSSPQFPVNN